MLLVTLPVVHYIRVCIAHTLRARLRSHAHFTIWVYVYTFVTVVPGYAVTALRLRLHTHGPVPRLRCTFAFVYGRCTPHTLHVALHHVTPRIWLRYTIYVCCCTRSQFTLPLVTPFTLVVTRCVYTFYGYHVCLPLLQLTVTVVLYDCVGFYAHAGPVGLRWVGWTLRSRYAFTFPAHCFTPFTLLRLHCIRTGYFVVITPRVGCLHPVTHGSAHFTRVVVVDLHCRLVTVTVDHYVPGWLHWFTRTLRTRLLRLRPVLHAHRTRLDRFYRLLPGSTVGCGSFGSTHWVGLPVGCLRYTHTVTYVPVVTAALRVLHSCAFLRLVHTVAVGLPRALHWLHPYRFTYTARLLPHTFGCRCTPFTHATHTLLHAFTPRTHTHTATWVTLGYAYPLVHVWFTVGLFTVTHTVGYRFTAAHLHTARLRCHGSYRFFTRSLLVYTPCILHLHTLRLRCRFRTVYRTVGCCWLYVTCSRATLHLPAHTQHCGYRLVYAFTHPTHLRVPTVAFTVTLPVRLLRFYVWFAVTHTFCAVGFTHHTVRSTLVIDSHILHTFWLPLRLRTPLRLGSVTTRYYGWITFGCWFTVTRLHTRLPHCRTLRLVAHCWIVTGASYLPVTFPVIYTFPRYVTGLHHVVAHV